MAERQFGPYKLVRQIAVGGMAEIHLAKAAGIAGFEKYVALKMIHPNFAEDEQFIQMLVDEAKIAVQLTHGNIAQTFDLGRVGETYYITMEYVDGADLYKILRRASEQDLEMPLDVCAFIGKEVSSALDHAHRKRDHAGKSLGIVHRDVSPQNVLVSYSGEVKLVDFGIAKATMKVRQTAVGVIKGKYYYMSPEQAWGDPIDHRSDIFSAGIVLYEMITGQMMYLEEDLHKLLEMARKAEIPPPSKLRKGVPPQLERIVMHALAKLPGERYQSAGDLATDLERFLHAYSPVFTASKLSTLVRQVVGDPIQVPDDPGFPSIEYRDGVNSTHPLDDSEVAHAIDAEDLRDENSVLFRVSELDRRGAKDAAAPPGPPGQPPGPAPGQPPGQRSTAPPARPSTPPPMPSVVRPSAPRTTRATDQMPALPSVPRDPARRGGSSAPSGPASSAGGAAQPAARTPARTPPAGRPRQAHEETRQLDQPAPPDPLHEDSGLLTPAGQKLSWIESDRSGTSDDLENIGERTVVTGAPGMGGPPVLGFMMDLSGDDPIEATLVTAAPTGFGLDPGGLGLGQDSTAEPAPDAGEAADSDDDEDGPTLSRDFSRDHPTKPARRALKAPPPAALAAKIHAPAVSELRKPRPSRRTPPGGMPAASPNVLQAIVASRSSEPMPVPRPTPPPAAIHATVAMPSTPPGMAPVGMGAAPGALSQPGPPGAMVPGMHAQTHPYGAPPFPIGTPAAQPSYAHDASGLPLGIPTPPGVTLPAASGHYQVPGQIPGHVPGLAGQVPGQVPGVHPDYLAQPPQMSLAGYPQLPSHAMPLSPNALYGLQAPPQPASLTGQLRWSEVDEIPSQYKLGAARRRWFTYIVSGLIAVSVAAGVTFLIIRLTREATPTVGSVHVVSVPAGADVSFDGTLLADRTPVTIDGAPVGTRHKIVVALRHYQTYTEEVAIPKAGGPVQVMAQLTSQTGKIVINTTPGGAQIWINGQPRGTTPTTLSGIDIDSTAQIELLHKDFGRQAVLLKWDAAGTAYVDYKFSH